MKIRFQIIDEPPESRSLRIIRLARRARIYRGVQAQVASAMGLSRAHISLVCRGLRSSRRVEKALAEAVLRIQKDAA